LNNFLRSNNIEVPRSGEPPIHHWVNCIYDEYYIMLLHFLRGKLLCDDALARDIAQEVFLKLCSRSPEELRQKILYKTVFPYIATIGRNIFIDNHRRNGHFIKYSNSALRKEHRYCELSNEEVFLSEEKNRILIVIKDELFEKLEIEKPIWYKAYYLYIVRGYSYEEISEKLSIPVNTVGTYIFNAKNFIKKMIPLKLKEKDWFF